MGNEDTFTIKQAATYLGLTLDGLKYHIYRKLSEPRLRPDGRFGRSLVFRRETLGQYKQIIEQERGVSAA